MSQLSASQHSRRQKNLLDATRSVSSCLWKHRIQNYLPGQVVYNLGEYPARFSIAPTEYDHELLSRFARHGVQLIQFHEEYSDPKRVLGADKFRSHDPEGLRMMIDLIHSLGMKVMLYISSGYFDLYDPDFQADWGYPGVFLKECYYTYANCSPASPGWRAYLLPRVEHLMDEYGIDGLYNDLGYLEIWHRDDVPPEHVSPEPETPQHDAALEDLLCMIMGVVRKRCGVLKIHYQSNMLPRCGDSVYDYLWTGESVEDLDGLRESTKSFPPYVVPCPDLSRARMRDEDELYLHSIPHLQFPLRVDGRPVTGERAMVAGIDYRDDFWTRHFRRIHDYHVKQPDGPHCYGWWDSPHGRPGARERWFHYFDLYKPMVEENTWCWIGITESSLFEGKLPECVTASLFVNESNYLAVANYGTSPVTARTTKGWQDRETGIEGTAWAIPTRKLKLLQRAGS